MTFLLHIATSQPDRTRTRRAIASARRLLTMRKIPGALWHSVVCYTKQATSAAWPMVRRGTRRYTNVDLKRGSLIIKISPDKQKAREHRLILRRTS
jgi:hypothetical protein